MFSVMENVISPYLAIRLAEKLYNKVADKDNIESRVSELVWESSLSALPSQEVYILKEHAISYAYRRRQEGEAICRAEQEFHGFSGKLRRFGVMFTTSIASTTFFTYYATRDFGTTLALAMTLGPSLVVAYQLLFEELPLIFQPLRALYHRLFSKEKENLRELRKEDRFRRDVSLIRLRGFRKDNTQTGDNSEEAVPVIVHIGPSTDTPDDPRGPYKKSA